MLLRRIGMKTVYWHAACLTPNLGATFNCCQRDQRGQFETWPQKCLDGILYCDQHNPSSSSQHPKPMNPPDVARQRIYFFKITGPQSIERLQPLLKSTKDLQWRIAIDSKSDLHFVWETSCKISERDQHLNSQIHNRLHNSQIIEDKSNLAFLQLRMTASIAVSLLETYVVENSVGIKEWFLKRWESGELSKVIQEQKSKSCRLELNVLLVAHK